MFSAKMSHQNQFEYGLSPKGKKLICPVCGHRTYTPYIFFSTGEAICEDFVGRCYRGGYHNGRLLSPSEWRKAHPEDSRFHKQMPCPVVKNGPLPSKSEGILTPDYISCKFMQDTLGAPNSFSKYLYRLFARSKVDEVLAAYNVGTYHYSPVWWQVDINGNVRAGKWMIYNKFGKRKKGFVGWREDDLQKAGQLKVPFERVQCMFGEHLLNKYPLKPICIVEAEKTAIVCAIARPQYVWVSVGSKSNFNANMMRPLWHRHCYAFPDGDAMQEWQAKAKDLRSQGYNIEVIDSYPSYVSEAQRAGGYDLADLILCQREIDRTLYHLRELVTKNQAIGYLVEKLTLAIDDL